MCLQIVGNHDFLGDSQACSFTKENETEKCSNLNYHDILILNNIEQRILSAYFTEILTFLF